MNYIYSYFYRKYSFLYVYYAGQIWDREHGKNVCIILTCNPIGIAIGYGISKTYDENSHLALILEGVFNAASAGILIYMALVDLLAVDFMKAKVHTSY